MKGTAPTEARDTLSALGRLLYDTAPRTLWDRDTETLPYSFRRLRHRYRAFAREHLAPRALAADLQPNQLDVPALFRTSAHHGFQTEFMPPPWGRLHLSSLWRSLLLPTVLKAEEFCAADGGLGLALLAHDLGVGPLFVSGDLRAYVRWLGRIYGEIRRGEPAICAFAITEPGAGSDVEDTDGAREARLGCHYEAVPGGYQVSGRKVFISDGAVARWVTLFAAEKGHGVDRWTCFLLDKSMAGFRVARKERKMGQRAADAAELELDQVFVPADRVIGTPGGGWAINRNVLNFSRPGVAAIALGIARGAFEHANAFCQDTPLGTRRLADYQEVRLALSDMLVKLQAMRATVWHTVRYPRPFQAAGAMSKVFCADTAWEVTTAAMRLLGDHGYVHGHSVEKAVRDARLTQIYEGTNQINRLAIYESQQGAEFAPDPTQERP